MLVTGGSGGIGAAVCRLAGRAGFAVAVGFNGDEVAAGKTVDSIRAGGGIAHAFQCDVADAGEVEKMFEAVDHQFGFPSALVNCAGTTGAIGNFASSAPDVWRRTFDVNVIGTMLCCQAVIRAWSAGGARGAIVNISSIAATLGAAGEYVHYAASKAAIEAFTVGLAREVAELGIRVNAVAPGTTSTGIHAAGGDPDRPVRLASRIPLKRTARPDEIAEAVAWMLSEKASYVTGAILRAGGGL